MINAARMLAVCVAILLFLDAALGYEQTYSVSSGAFTIMAAMVSLTFFGLWLRRATPLAEGMAFGWAGATFVMGWWWLYNLLDRPESMQESPILFLFVGVYFVGAIMHFVVIGSSLGLPRWLNYLPVCLAIFLSVLVQALTR